jgi:hypothetical protein
VQSHPGTITGAPGKAYTETLQLATPGMYSKHFTFCTSHRPVTLCKAGMFLLLSNHRFYQQTSSNWGDLIAPMTLSAKLSLKEILKPFYLKVNNFFMVLKEKVSGTLST